MTRIELKTNDGHTLGAERVLPERSPLGAVVVVQEIFGVNAHIKAVTARFAAAGYAAIAPAVFDRVERGVELGYGPEDFQRGRDLVAATTPAGIFADLAAARDAVASAGPVTLVGYCFGGALVWAAAAELSGLAAVVSYYGSRIARYQDLVPRVPVLIHAGRHDASFPLEVVHTVAQRPGVTAHIYEAGHGFSCDHRKDFDPDAAALALERTLGFLARTQA